MNGLEFNNYWEMLPRDALYEILRQQPNSALVRMSQVCTSWKCLCEEIAWKPFAEERNLTGFTCPLEACSEYVKEYDAFFFQICPSFRGKDKNDFKDFLYEHRQGYVAVPGINVFEVKEIIDGCFAGTMNSVMLEGKRWTGNLRVPFFLALDSNNTREMTMLFEMGVTSSPDICEYAFTRFGTGPNADRISFADISDDMFRLLLKGVEPTRNLVEAIASTGRMALIEITLKEWQLPTFEELFGKDVEIPHKNIWQSGCKQAILKGDIKLAREFARIGVKLDDADFIGQMIQLVGQEDEKIMPHFIELFEIAISCGLTPTPTEREQLVKITAEKNK